MQQDYLSNHPLILVHLTHLDHPQQLPQLHELGTPKGLSENISRLLICSNMVNIHLALLDTLSDKMKTSVDVFAPVMKHRILAECDCRFVVHEQPHFPPLFSKYFT